jgi:hypothetical protein
MSGLQYFTLGCILLFLLAIIIQQTFFPLKPEREVAREHVKEKVFPLYQILDEVMLKNTQVITITKISMSEETGKFFYAGPGTKWFPENSLIPMKVATFTEKIEEELIQEATINPQTYLSRLDKYLDADEAIKYFGKEKLLDEIGIKDAVIYYGELQLLEEIGQAQADKYWHP